MKDWNYISFFFNFRLLGCYAQVVFSKSIKSDTFSSLHQNVDIAVFREITEGEYSGIEHEAFYYKQFYL
jgi:isocitrate/isopropylmalate dehydrogenase